MKITLPIQYMATLIVFITADTMAVLAEHHICTVSHHGPAQSEQSWEIACLIYRNRQMVGSNSHSKEHEQVEIDLVARDGKDYLIGECKWKNEPLDYKVLSDLRKKADVMMQSRDNTWFVLFSKSGFTDAVLEEAKRNKDVIPVSLEDLFQCI